MIGGGKTHSAEKRNEKENNWKHHVDARVSADLCIAKSTLLARTLERFGCGLDKILRRSCFVLGHFLSRVILRGLKSDGVIFRPSSSSAFSSIGVLITS